MKTRLEMPARTPSAPMSGDHRHKPVQEWTLVLLSVLIQLVAGMLFGHVYDMRIFMATGYLVGTGQNPYVPQDLSAIFHNPAFQGITTVGYPPPWPLMLGAIYRVVYATFPNFLAYNAAIKVPLILANVALAYLAAACLRRLGADGATAYRAWVFLLLNPFLIYASAAWGQFDSIVALLSLVALMLLAGGKKKSSAVLLALAIAFKPTAMPLLIVPFFYLKMKSMRQVLTYYIMLVLCELIFCVLPFWIFRWDPAVILQNWNAHFVVGGGLSPMAALELAQTSYRLPGNWWLLGLLWIPALGIASLALRGGIAGLSDLIKKSTALIMVFFLTRMWLSEPNVILVLPLVLILSLTGDLNRLALSAVWILPLIFGIANVSAPQLFFPSMPHVMDTLLQQMDKFHTARLIAKVLVVIPWQIAGWWIVRRCLRPSSMEIAA
jgi:hypothetical protein